MFKEYFLSEARSWFRKWWFYGLLLVFITLGALTSKVANFSFPGIYLNSSWVLTYITGLLSLANIFVITILAARILFREKDSRFDAILYAAPLNKKTFLFSRFTLISAITLLCFLLLLSGLMLGHLLRAQETDRFTSFHLLNYLSPFLALVVPDVLLCTSIVCAVAWLTRNKLIVYLSGLSIYILYVVGSLFSNSPLFVGASPPSATSMALAAKLDPFGMAAFFEQTQYWSLQLRNSQLIQWRGNFLFNRLWVLCFSALLAVISNRVYCFRIADSTKRKLIAATSNQPDIEYRPVSVSNSGITYAWATFLSFVKLDIRSILKRTPFILLLLLWTFFLGMEIYSDIDAGIRLPQRYATSGLIVKNITGTFPFFIIVVLLFYSVELLWRSRNVDIDAIEHTTPADTSVILTARWMSLIVIPALLIAFSILMGIAFQLLFQYPVIDFAAYASLFYVLGVPAMLYAGIIIIIQVIVRRKYTGLVIAALFLLITNSFIGNKLGLGHPLFRFARSFVGIYSDMAGYGAYLQAFGIKMLYWLAFTIGLWSVSLKRFKLTACCIALMTLTGVFISGKTRMVDEIEWEQKYEEAYRKYQHIPQPTISSVRTNIDLYPENNKYEVKGEYILVNKEQEPLDSFLLYCDPAITLQHVKIENASLLKSDQQFGHYSYRLSEPLHPGDSIRMQFTLSYKWTAFNRHDPLNAIVENGAFMRISRCYPVFGYQAGNEINDEAERTGRQMAAATPLKRVEEKDTAAYNYGFIHFDAIISTTDKQTAIGTGELLQSWKQKGRNYFHYSSPVPIPFRFAVSSGEYAIRRASQNGITIEVYYHPAHHENVDHLIAEAKNTIAYCEKNFGKYPFRSIRFAEVSGFTEGFAATAYPAAIFMSEKMTFHADIRKEKQRDVINELAGHELSHQWWGTAQIAPEDREGAAMLTETLAMYTELMLFKEAHGVKAMKETVAMHQELYEKERGYSTEEPLYKVKPDNVHISYNKGLVAMYRLYELIGEEKVNLALKQFIARYAFPNHPPTTIDLINCFLAVSNTSVHTRIKKIFMQ